MSEQEERYEAAPVIHGVDPEADLARIPDHALRRHLRASWAATRTAMQAVHELREEAEAWKGFYEEAMEMLKTRPSSLRRRCLACNEINPLALEELRAKVAAYEEGNNA